MGATWNSLSWRSRGREEGNAEEDDTTGQEESVMVFVRDDCVAWEGQATEALAFMLCCFFWNVFRS